MVKQSRYPMTDNPEQRLSKDTEDFTLKEFYETTPPGGAQRVSDLTEFTDGHLKLNRPDITLHCDTPNVCEGIRQYRCTTQIYAERGTLREYFVKYICRSCSLSSKSFAVRCIAEKDSGSYSGEIYKYGELPNFGPPTPPRLTRLLGGDKELFLKATVLRIKGWESQHSRTIV